MCLMAILKPKNNYTAQLLGKMENSVPFQKEYTLVNSFMLQFFMFQ